MIRVAEREDLRFRDARLRWAELLRRIFEVDPLRCPLYVRPAVLAPRLGAATQHQWVGDFGWPQVGEFGGRRGCMVFTAMFTPSVVSTIR